MTDGMSLAEQRAADEGLPVVMAMPFELQHVASGKPMIMQTVDGGEVLLRLFTTDELIDFVSTHGERPISRQQAEKVTRPWTFPTSGG